MTFKNRMRAAEKLIKQKVTAEKDPRVKEYEDHARKLAEERKANPAQKRGRR